MKLTLVCDHWWEADFVVDFAKAAAPCLQSLEFFGDPIEREDESPESTVRAFIKFWAPQIILLSVNKTLAGVLDELAGMEGIFPLDGSRGVQLVRCENWRWDEEDFLLLPDRPTRPTGQTSPSQEAP